MLLQELQKRGLIKPPNWLPDNCAYLTIMGSVAYGVSSDTSDMDIYGFCIPSKSIIFPHLEGEIEGFGRQKKRFGEWQEHHIVDPDALGGKGRSYDFAVFNIVKYFSLCMDNNPNMIDSIFTPISCVLHATKVANIVRANRKLFLHKGSYHRFLGYAHSQLHKMSSKNPKKSSKRAALREQFGMDVKYAYHLVRLSDECEQILSTGDLYLQRAKEHMKAVRRGDVSERDLRAWFSERERTLEKLYSESKLPHSPDEDKIKALLLNCLEEHYGSLANCVVMPDAAKSALQEIQAVLNRYSMIKS